MKFYVGITDSTWFNFLAERRPDEVNFWRPNSDRNFTAIETGAPFLFKLHSPSNYIVGGGFLVRHSAVPLSLAWDAFGQNNGAADYQSFRALLGKHRTTQDPDPVIGCTVLGEPFFFPKDQWIPVPKTWASNIVTGKCYDMTQGEGLILWSQVEERLRALAIRPSIVSDGPRYGQEYLARARLGQGSFRLLVTEAYQRRCAITGERILPVLEAAHIKRYSVGGPHRVSNGVLLRSDLHTLFDKGYVTITPDFHVEVSPRLKEKFHNGREYYKFHGRSLEMLPADGTFRPSREFLEWHNQYSCAV